MSDVNHTSQDRASASGRDQAPTAGKGATDVAAPKADKAKADKAKDAPADAKADAPKKGFLGSIFGKKEQTARTEPHVSIPDTKAAKPAPNDAHHGAHHGRADAGNGVPAVVTPQKPISGAPAASSAPSDAPKPTAATLKPQTDTSRHGLMAMAAERTIRAVPRKYRKYVAWASVACCLIAFSVSVAFNGAYAVTMGQTQFHHVVYCSLAFLVSLAILLATHALVLLPNMSGGHKISMHALRAFAFLGALYFGTGFASMTKDIAVGEARTKIQMRDKVSGGAPATNVPPSATRRTNNGMTGGVR